MVPPKVVFMCMLLFKTALISKMHSVHVIFYHILANGNDRKTKDKIIVSTGLIFKLKKYIYNIMFTHQDHPIFQLQCIWVEYVCLP